MLKKVLSLGLSAALLSACGGGSSGGSGGNQTPDDNNGSASSPDAEQVLIGQFIDSPVAGLFYQTNTQSGLTNENGEFTYIDGETIRFSLGGTLLGSAQANELVTPFDLTGVRPYTAEAQVVRTLSSSQSTGFDRALNIATLLQTLDQDGNPENGIDLGNAHALLTDQSVNLSVKAVEFNASLSESTIKQSLDITHSKNLDQVVEHLYRGLGLEIESSLVESFSTSKGRNSEETVSFEYNESGKIVSQSTDIDADGEADLVKSFEYDEQGNIKRIENSAVNTIELMYYNDDNQIVGRSISTPSSGNKLSEIYSYDGNQLSRLETSIENTTHVSSYQYSSEGKLRTILIDKDNDGENDRRSEYQYEDGQIASFSEDLDNDGQSELNISYEYDSKGNRRTHSVDTNHDGEPDQINTFTYDTNNHLARYEQDKNMNGKPDYIEDYTHNVQGHRTRYRKDLDADGKWDFVAHYTYDANGNRTRMIEDSDGNGMADKVWERNYQAANQNKDWSQILQQIQ